MVLHVEWYIAERLGNWDYVLAERVRNSRFIHHIRILIREVNDDHLRMIDQAEDILDDCRSLPDIIDTPAPQVALLARFPYCFVHAVEFHRKGHHHRNKVKLDIAVWGLKYMGRKCDSPLGWLC